MAMTYTTKRLGATVLLNPTRPKLAAAVHLNGPWPHIVESIRSSLGAGREYLIEHGYPKRGVTADDLGLEIIERAGDLDYTDRYLLRLVLGQLCRDADSKARQITTTTTAPPTNGPFAHSVRYGDGHNNQ